jgi:putative transposase
VLSAEEVASLYRMRWEIELTFKELKSQYALDAFRTTNANIVEALIWAALVASRRIYNLVRARAPPELKPRHTPMMWSNEFREGGGAVLGFLLAYVGYEEFSEKE